MSKKGWASASDGDKRTSEKNTLNILEQERFLNSLDLSSEEIDIPTIPDVDDIVPENAPQNRTIVNTSTIKTSICELDTELIKQTSIEGLDLSILTRRCILNEKDIKEDDVPWTWNNLFIEFNNSNISKKEVEEDQHK